MGKGRGEEGGEDEERALLSSWAAAAFFPRLFETAWPAAVKKVPNWFMRPPNLTGHTSRKSHFTAF